MEWRLILASSRWHRWVRWSAPRGRPPTPGCRSSQMNFPPAPILDSSPCRWWLRSSQTNLQGGKGDFLIILAIIILVLDQVSVCLVSWAEPCLAAVTSRSVSQKAFPRITSHFFMLVEPHCGLCKLFQLCPPTNLVWHGTICLSDPPILPRHTSHRQPYWHLNTARLAVFPVSFLFGWVGNWVPGNVLAPWRENLGFCKGLPRENTMDLQ